MICHISSTVLSHDDHLWLCHITIIEKCVFIFTQCCLLLDLTTKSQRTGFGYIPLSPIFVFGIIIYCCFWKMQKVFVIMHYFFCEWISATSNHGIFCHVTNNIVRVQPCDPKYEIFRKKLDIK